MALGAIQLLAQASATRGPLPLVLGLCGIALLLFAVAFVPPFFKWVKMVRRVPGVTLLQVLGMHWRKAPLDDIASAMEVLQGCGASIELMTLETWALAGGKVHNVARAYEVLHGARFVPKWESLAAIDLARRDVYLLAKTVVTPRVVEVSGSASERGVEMAAADETCVRCRLRVQLSANMNAVIGGLQEADVVAACVEEVRRRVGEVATARDVAGEAERILGEFLLPESKVPRAWEVVKIELVEVGLV